MNSIFLKNPIFICGHRKSGTTMLASLFDNHDDLLVYPSDSMFFYKVFPACLNLKKKDNIKLVLENCIRDTLNYEIKNTGKKDLFDVDKISTEFLNEMSKKDNSPKSLLLSLIKAYSKSCKKKRWKMWVEKTTSSEFYATEIANWFPNAKFIHLVRDPRDNFASLKSGWEERYKNQEEDIKGLLQSLIDRGGMGMRIALNNQKVLGEKKYKIIKFEDLTSKTDKIIKELISFINIKFSESLLKPTMNGYLWKGNNFQGITFNKVSNMNVNKWKKRINLSEAMTIEAYLSDIMKKFKYKVTGTPANHAEAILEHYKWFNFRR